jgi:AraC family transcriptional regulator
MTMRQPPPYLDPLAETRDRVGDRGGFFLSPQGRANHAAPHRDVQVPREHMDVRSGLRSSRNPVGKALWFIESRLASAISIDDVAAVSGVSRYHLARAFEFATGQGLVRYIRGRRLTEAARLIANGAPDILMVALESGFGSHDGFCRAFRAQFGVSPETVRMQRHLDRLELVEPVRMEMRTMPIEPPRFMEGGDLRIVGMPSPWHRFQPAIGKVEGQVSNATFGVRCNHDDAGNYDYLSGVEVADFTHVPVELHRLWIPAQRYAVFTHRGHLSELRHAWHTIWSQWLPESGHEAVEGPDFERYEASFDPRAGRGRVELWVPIRR